MSGLERIEEVFAFVMRDPRDGLEGIPAMAVVEDGRVMLAPMIGSAAGVERMRMEASIVARASGQSVELRRFVLVEVVETIEP